MNASAQTKKLWELPPLRHTALLDRCEQVVKQGIPRNYIAE